ncbi:phosphoethanolamine transferase [Morganella morganii]
MANKTKFILVSFLSISYFVYFFKHASDALSPLLYLSLFITITIIGLKFKSFKAIAASYFIVALFTIIELITKRMTGFYFHEIPYEIISILYDTNQDEIKSGMHFDRTEKIAILICTINFVFLFLRQESKQKNITKTIMPILILIMFFSATSNPISITAKTIYNNKLSIEKAIDTLNTRKSFLWGSKSYENEQQTVVIFLGETHRGDYMSINGYNKKTTPRLETKDIISFDNAISQGAYTLISTPMILTRKNVTDSGIFPEKSIISAFKEAGYETWYISYLSKSHIGDNEINIIANEADHYIRDGVDNNVLKSILSAKSNKKLIVYKTIGSHFTYHTRYPSSYEIFKPAFTEETYKTPSIDDIELLKNSYENSILFSVDKHISDFIEILDKEKGLVSLSFVSDHGTSIYDNGKSLYGGNTEGNYNIGLFFWFNDHYKNKYSDDIMALKNNKHKKVSSEYFVDTMLEIGKIKTEKTKGRSLLEENLIEHDRMVINKNIYNYDKEISSNKNK